MRSKYPLKKISVLNVWLTSTCVLFVFAFVIIFKGINGIHDAILGALLTLIILILTSFANIMWVLIFREWLTSFSSKIKRVYYTLSYIFSIFIFLIVVLTYNYFYQQQTNVIDIISLIVISIFGNTIIVVFHNYIVLQDAKMNADMENSQLKAANAEAANQLLRQQIHPHFFFNALNILKSLYKLDAVAAEEYLVCLSNFLRTSISSNNIKIISLKDELKLCEDYLGMQKIRFGEALICSVSITDDIIENGLVPSFSIQPLLENAIKHNELTKASPLYIMIEQVGNKIKVTNNIKTKVTTETSTGIGLANLAERYRILSNDELIIENEGTSFSVSIKIFNKEEFRKDSTQNLFN